MNDHQQKHMFTPQRMRPVFGSENRPGGVRTNDPASVSDAAIHPDNQPDQNSESTDVTYPVVSGSLADVPDHWITGSAALETLTLAGLLYDGRKVRNLCSRNQIVNIKVKNERNQWQYFIDPQSLEAFIDKRRQTSPEEFIRTTPDASGQINPDTRTEELQDQPKQLGEADPATPGRNDPQPEASGVGESEVIATLREQIREQKEEILFLREEAKDNRLLKRDLKDISSKMLDTFAAVATNRQIAPAPEEPEPATYRNVTGGEDTHSANRDHGV